MTLPSFASNCSVLVAYLSFHDKKVTKRCNEFTKELPAICLPHQDGGIPLSALPTAQQVNLPAHFLHCPFNAERQVGSCEYQF